MFENRLTKLRESKKLNMKQTAQKLGIPYTTYVGYEKNEREPNSEVLILLADFFNCSVDYLIGRSDEKINETVLDKVNSIDDDLLQQYGNIYEAQKAQNIRDTENLNIINKITQMLSRRGYTQKDLTDYLGIEKSVFSTWKSGKSQSYKKYFPEIAEFLNVSVDYLTGLIEEDDRSVQLIARHLEQVPQEDRKQIIDAFEQTIDIYLAAKGLKKD